MSSFLQWVLYWQANCSFYSPSSLLPSQRKVELSRLLLNSRMVKLFGISFGCTTNRFLIAEMCMLETGFEALIIYYTSVISDISRRHIKAWNYYILLSVCYRLTSGTETIPDTIILETARHSWKLTVASKTWMQVQYRSLQKWSHK